MKLSKSIAFLKVAKHLEGAHPCWGFLDAVLHAVYVYEAL